MDTHSEIKRGWFGGLTLALQTDAVVGVRTRYLESPNRIVLEFDDMDFSALPDDFGKGNRALETLQFGATQKGARMVLTLKDPYRVKSFDFSDAAVDGQTGLFIEFEEISQEEFHQKALQMSGVELEDIPLPPEPKDDAKPLIVIDAGHGGIDPGAEREGVDEKDVTLNASKILANVLRKTGQYEVVLTREEDVFASLLARRQFAERMGADVFLSIHADTLEEGDARGTTIYEVSNEASSQIAAHFAQYENRVDLFAGEVDYQDQTDIGMVLTNMAYQSSKEKADLLARLLQQNWQMINVVPEESRRETADFAVLKTPEIPSLLLEIGYMSNDQDFEKIQNNEWLTEMSQAVAAALETYFKTD